MNRESKKAFNSTRKNKQQLKTRQLASFFIFVMFAGRVVEHADVKQLFELPNHPYTYGLLQSITTMDSDRSKKLYSIKGSIPGLSPLPSGCQFHPRCPFRRIFILKFLDFSKDYGVVKDQQKFIRFGNGGLIRRLQGFMRGY